jgi:hypothetical protein
VADQWYYNTANLTFSAVVNEPCPEPPVTTVQGAQTL